MDNINNVQFSLIYRKLLVIIKFMLQVQSAYLTGFQIEQAEGNR